MLPITYIGQDHNIFLEMRDQVPSAKLMDYCELQRSRLEDGIYIFDEEDRIWSYERIIDKFREHDVDPHMVLLQDGPLESLNPIYHATTPLFEAGYNPANLLNKQSISDWIIPLIEYSHGKGPLTEATYEFRTNKRER